MPTVLRAYPKPEWRLSLATLLVVTWTMAGISLQAHAAPDPREPVVQELETLLQEQPALKKALETAIDRADVQHIHDLEALYAYLDEFVTWIPTERELVPRVLKVYYIINQAPADALNASEDFNRWLKQLVRVWGEFLDTPASARNIDSFLRKPNYNIDDYFVGPSGWLTFNQFFAREMKPGKRPISDPRNDRVFVSPADAVFMGHWPISDTSSITVKGVEWDIAELLDGSPYRDAFRNGTYMHSFLYVDDYHRYHVPVGGTIREIRNVSGRVYLDVRRNADGSLDVIDGDTYQFNQERGLVVIDSPELGLVAVLPIGMATVSSVNLTPEVGAELRKGDEFGYFLFGGSDIVMIFQDIDLEIEAEMGTKYLQGQRLGRMK